MSKKLFLGISLGLFLGCATSEKKHSFSITIENNSTNLVYHTKEGSKGKRDFLKDCYDTVATACEGRNGQKIRVICTQINNKKVSDLECKD